MQLNGKLDSIIRGHFWSGVDTSMRRPRAHRVTGQLSAVIIGKYTLLYTTLLNITQTFKYDDHLVPSVPYIKIYQAMSIQYYLLNSLDVRISLCLRSRKSQLLY